MADKLARMSQLHSNSQKVQDALRAAGLSARVELLTQEARTAAAAAEQLGCEVGAIANSLVFIADNAPLLVMSSGAHRVDVDHLRAAHGIGVLRPAKAAEVLAATGQPIGGVAPIGHPAPLATLIDSTLAHHPQVWMGGGVPNSIFALTFAELVAITGGTLCEVRPAAAVAE